MTIEEAQAKMAQMKENGRSFEGLANAKAQLDEKGLTLDEAKENFGNKLSEFATANGMTIEEAQAKMAQMKENGMTLEKLNNLKGIVSNIPVQ